MAKKLCELHALNEDLAEAFGTDEEQIKQWAKDHLDFSKACIAGRGAARKRLSNMLLEIATGSQVKRDKIVTIKGTPARISIKEGGRVSSAAVAALFAYYEKNNRLMDVGDPWTEFFRRLEGTCIRPKENSSSTAVV
jgi:hypothetical protein